MSNYPTGIDDNTTLPNPSDNSLTSSPNHATLHTTENDAIKALEAKLGTGSSTSTASTVLRSSSSGTSTWGKLVLTNDVTGILPVSSGGTGAATLTGLAKGNGTSVFTTAVAGTDYQAVIGATGVLKGAGSGSVVAATAGTDYLTPTGNETVTNHDIKSATNTFAAVTTVTSSSTPTPTGDSRQNELYITALAAGATIVAPTGSATNGNKLLIRIKDNGTAQTLAFNAIFRFSSDQPAPTTTVISKTLYIGAIYNSADTKWDVVLVLGNF